MTVITKFVRVILSGMESELGPATLHAQYHTTRFSVMFATSKNGIAAAWNSGQGQSAPPVPERDAEDSLR